MFKVFGSVYSPVGSRSDSSHSDDENCGFIEEKHYGGPSHPKPGFWDFVPRFSIILPWFLALLNLGLFLQQYMRHPSELDCTRLLNAYSPAIDAGIVEYYETNFQNEFGGGTIELPLDGPSKLNKSSERLKHVQKDAKRGYVAILEVSHQLHCLNLVRQYTWKDYYATHMGKWISEEGHGIVDLNVTDPVNIVDRMHADHCIEALRLQLMCNADLTPLLIELDDSNGFGQKADFNVHHKCRNWDKVTEWQYANSIEREDK
ncbi:hypothetical protein FHL15_007871 [Xylaria flabelliformis]|uniref:Uncharacterized protein n=1 Tax=Xylaria flabelliformis TaxID=2512241 RepID=A0A553HTJ0_9PEZI|nr:hypothetical protein FHL15_007871 [Xylaria flabelliformis]